MPRYDELCKQSQKSNAKILKEILEHFNSDLKAYYFFLQQLYVLHKAIYERFYELKLDKNFSLNSCHIVFSHFAIKNDLDLIKDTLRIEPEPASFTALYSAAQIKEFDKPKLIALITSYGIHANEIHSKIRAGLLENFKKLIPNGHHGLSYYLHPENYIKDFKNDIEKCDNDTFQHYYIFITKFNSLLELARTKQITQTIPEAKPSIMGMFAKVIPTAIGLGLGAIVWQYGVNKRH